MTSDCVTMANGVNGRANDQTAYQQKTKKRWKKKLPTEWSESNEHKHLLFSFNYVAKTHWINEWLMHSAKETKNANKMGILHCLLLFEVKKFVLAPPQPSVLYHFHRGYFFCLAMIFHSCPLHNVNNNNNKQQEYSHKKKKLLEQFHHGKMYLFSARTQSRYSANWFHSSQQREEKKI